MPMWTQAQQEAIGARGRDILVSAAAGSGKTAVLVERILALLRGGGSLDRMLVVTFTRAAAAEMRDRLTRALSLEAAGDRRLRRQFMAVDRSDICTLHTFCARVLRRCFQAADADPLSRVGDESLTRELFERALQEAMEALCQSPGEDGGKLITQYEDGQIEDMVRSLHGFLMAQADPWEWLGGCLTLPEDLAGHPWHAIAREEALLFLEGAEALLEDCARIAGLPDGPLRHAGNAREDLTSVRELLRALEEEGRLPQREEPAFSPLSRRKAGGNESASLAERFKHRRGLAKQAVQAACALLPAGPEQTKRILGDLRYTLPALRALAALTQSVHERYAALKEARLVWDYGDLEHLALRALNQPDAAREVSAGLDAVFVDEYQDVSRIQEAIIQRLRGNAALFMVGDARQSIYRFRLADPGLFLSKQRRFGAQPDPGERLVTLSENFRSRKNILDAVNLVFGHAMRERATEIGYGDDAALRTREEGRNDPPVELRLLLRDEETEEDPAREPGEDEGGEEAEERADKSHVAEARIIALRIRELLGTPLWDGKECRPLRCRDIVILLRSASGRAGDMSRALGDAGIPVYSEADAQYFDLPEVADALNLLRVLDNPCQDTALLSALACPAFGYSPADLAQIRLRGGEGQAPFHEVFFGLRDADARIGETAKKLERWRFMAANMPLDAFLRRLLRETGLYARAGALPGGELRRANLRLLCERAAPGPLPVTLREFLSRVKEARRQEQSQAAAALSENEDVVRIMTLHKSKGLEFPVVFIPCLGRRFRMTGSSEPLLCDAEAGLALRLRDPEKRMTYPTFAGKAIALKKNREIRSEEARLLYVGMTRARDRLILVGTLDSLAAAGRKWSLPGGDYAAGSAVSMLDWVGACLWPALEKPAESPWAAANGSVWRLFLHRRGDIRAPEPPAPAPALGMSAQPPSPDMVRIMEPVSRGRQLPMKTSVTALISGRAGSDGEEEETPQVKRRALRLDEAPVPLPALDGKRGLTGAQRGAAMHRALCALHPAALRGLRGEALLRAAGAELDALLERGVLSPQERDAADLSGLARFFASPLGGRLLAAADLRREWPFTFATETGMLLQGVVDSCFLEGDAWVLIDYKTDRCAPGEILPRYRDQMRWYMRALREITGTPVREAWLYALHAGEAIPVIEEAPIRLER